MKKILIALLALQLCVSCEKVEIPKPEEKQSQAAEPVDNSVNVAKEQDFEHEVLFDQSSYCKSGKCKSLLDSPEVVRVPVIDPILFCKNYKRIPHFAENHHCPIMTR